MIRSRPLLTLPLVALAACGGGESRKSLNREAAERLDELAGVVRGIRGGDGLESARPEVERLVAELERLGRRRQELPEPEPGSAAADASPIGEALSRLMAAVRGLDPAQRERVESWLGPVATAFGR